MKITEKVPKSCTILMQNDFENNFDNFFGADVEHLRFSSSNRYKSV